MRLIAKTQLGLKLLRTTESNHNEKKKQKLDTWIVLENLCMGLIKNTLIISPLYVVPGFSPCFNDVHCLGHFALGDVRVVYKNKQVCDMCTTLE